MSSPEAAQANRLQELQRNLGYEFKRLDLLEQALTHKSFAKQNNERLEFLGDAVLGYLVGAEIFAAYPDVREDTLSLMRSQLVRKESLAHFGRELGLAECLRIGVGEKRSGGRHRASLVADAFEAVLGAMHEDCGIEACEKLVREIFREPVLELANQELRDPKTQLQEWLQGRKLKLPEYEVESVSGADHQRQYRIRCTVPEVGVSTSGEGTSRRSAEKAAASAMLEALRSKQD